MPHLYYSSEDYKFFRKMNQYLVRDLRFSSLGQVFMNIFIEMRLRKNWNFLNIISFNNKFAGKGYREDGQFNFYCYFYIANNEQFW